MQARRRAQPSGTNRPSSYPHPRVGVLEGCRALRARSGRMYGPRVFPPRCAAPRARGAARLRDIATPVGGRSAAHRSAATACGARPVPFRTRKLSRTAPMVLRGKPVGEQGAADRWTALAFLSREGGGLRPPFFHVAERGGSTTIYSWYKALLSHRFLSRRFHAAGSCGRPSGSLHLIMDTISWLS